MQDEDTTVITPGCAQSSINPFGIVVACHTGVEPEVGDGKLLSFLPGKHTVERRRSPPASRPKKLCLKRRILNGAGDDRVAIVDLFFQGTFRERRQRLVPIAVINQEVPFRHHSLYEFRRFANKSAADAECTSNALLAESVKESRGCVVDSIWSVVEGQ